jgi:hypothetical protein
MDLDANSNDRQRRRKADNIGALLALAKTPRIGISRKRRQNVDNSIAGGLSTASLA